MNSVLINTAVSSQAVTVSEKDPLNKDKMHYKRIDDHKWRQASAQLFLKSINSCERAVSCFVL